MIRTRKRGSWPRPARRAGERPPASFSSETMQGLTGYESDDELGLVNLKGRIYDSEIERFLTTDLLISIPFFGKKGTISRQQKSGTW
ncbi:hypothetical protein [Sorangium sp. So ce124]|uniref:hypothetical protein n=1 Tax=Sorangium sp. So ce124 TaxID=3133280 RepID=UPI003F606840